ncbi:MAG: gliding motility lipoprotein GldH [Bacteroidaceae bacterium]|nr:gliding motility lipoprotein GldH [Bacteroidaceae bacterium]
MNNDILYNYKGVAEMTWGRTDTVRFEIPRMEAGTHGISVGVRFSEQMPYADLWLVVEHRIDTTEALALPKPLMIGRDTVHLVVADDEKGWTVPGLTLHSAEIKAKTLETPAARASFLIYHVMEREDIPGISDIGIKVE